MSAIGVVRQAEGVHPAEEEVGGGWDASETTLFDFVTSGDSLGLTLVHYSAQLVPFLTQKHTLNSLNTPYHLLNTHETTPNCTPCHTEGA